MKIGYVSDLHLEFKDYPDLSNTEGGDILILAGDITTAHAIRPGRTDQDYRSWKKYAEKFKIDVLDKYDAVFYVMGNHEHYQSVFSSTAKGMIDGFKAVGWDKVKLFDNDWVVVDDVVFIGATLWSDFENNNDLSKWDCGRFMNDYRLIYREPTKTLHLPIDPEFTLNEHYKSVAYIREILKLNKADKAFVFTHMAPSYVSLNKEHSGNGLDGAYASDLSDLICSFPQIKYWAHGHTHMNVNYDVCGTKVIANQRGYRGEKSHKLFGGIKHVEI